jgi:hypothetical protein
MGLQHMWQGMVDVAGSRNAAMMGLKRAFGNYDYAEDEEYIKDVTLLQKNPSKNNLAAFYSKWEDDLDGKTLEEITEGLQYVEGTNQYYETQLNKTKVEKSDIDMKYYEDLAEIDFGLAENKLSISDTQERISEDWGYKGAELDYKTNLENLTNVQLSNKIKELDYQMRLVTDPIKLEMLEADKKLLLSTLQDKIDIYGYKAEGAEVDAKVAQETEEEQISMAESKAGILENDLRFSNQSFEDRLLSLQLGNKSRRLGNEYQGYQNEVYEETMPALKNAPYLQNESTILGNEAQRDKNYILDKTKEGQVDMFALELELARIKQDQAQRKSDYTQTLSDEELYGTSDIENWAIDKYDWVATPEGIPQLGENDRGVIVDARSGKAHVTNGEIILVTKGYNGEDVYTREPADYFVAGSAETGKKYTEEDKNEEEPNTLLEWLKNKFSGNGEQQQPANNRRGSWNDNPKYPLVAVLNRLKQDNGVQDNAQLLSVLTNASPEVRKSILDAYGYSTQHLIYSLSNM